MQIRNIVIYRASTVAKVLDRTTKRAENGEFEKKGHTYWTLVGMYESRIFGLVIFRAHSNKFIDELTNRYVAAANAHGMQLEKPKGFDQLLNN